MAASVYNRQRKKRVDVQALRHFLGELTGRLEVDDDFSVVLLSDRAMSSYNRRYRDRKGPTDVLSFPNVASTWDRQRDLGDILISVETADRRKPAALHDELRVLCLHGLLHLLGYDHERDRGEMRELEAKLKKELRLP